ncbi:hypothetical protein BH11BAC7_BH11BAC7_05690 [soil metagenome]
MLRFYKDLIPLNSLCFDIGANRGKYTTLFLKCKAQIIAVEPQLTCSRLLKELFTGEKRVTLINAAIGSEVATGTLHIGNNDEVSTLSADFIEAYSIYSHNAWNEKEEVCITTLDQLIEAHGLPFFCKLDIEGWESEALRGLSHAIPLISFEYNFLLKPKSLECITMLSGKGNYVFNFSAYENCIFTSVEWLNDKKMAAFIMEMPAVILHGDLFARLIN